MRILLYPTLMRRHYRAIMLLLILSLAACAGPISRETLKGIDRGVTLSIVRADSARYQGKSVILGGEIIQVVNEKERTLIEILQLRLDRFNRPAEDSKSSGRFLVVKAGFLDPAIYKTGLLITAVGIVKEIETRPLGETTYDYVVIEMTEDHLFEKRERSEPRIHFGIGVGTSF